MSPPTAEGLPVALVTGARGGLGRALVEAFAAAGWRVVAAGRTQAEEAGDDSHVDAVAFDVRHAPAVAEGVAGVLERHGRIDAVVHAAGVARDALLPRVRDDEWTEVLDTHLRGAFLVARAVLPSMIDRRRGHLVFIGSWSGRVGAVGQSVYAAAKAGLAGLTVSLAREVGGLGVQVNAVLPGVMATRMTHGLSEGSWQAFASANVLGRINDPGTVARQIVFLAAQRDVSGQVFAWDSRIARWG